MPLLDPNWNPSHRQLRQFGVLCALGLPCVVWYWGWGTTVVGLAIAVGIILALSSFAVPSLIRPLFIGLMVITIPIGIVVSELTLLLVYLLVFVPMGMFFRLLRRDRLQIKLDRQSATYWQQKTPPKTVRNYYRQF